MMSDALNRIVEARKIGVEGAALDALEARARKVPAPAAGAAAGGDTTPALDLSFDDEPLDAGDRLDEDDLSSITSALEAEYGDAAVPIPGGPPAAPATEQSVDEVFDTFKEHVKAAVGAEDFRTHYDLGIAYKEMGLLDAALAEFHIASATPELYRESCSMLGLCHWERGEADEAIRWYRAAIEAPGGDEVPLAGLRYELADLLEASGDARGAYDLLSLVVAEQPGYRDVDSRIATLRGRLGL
jgi:tetratricopeptide (TPR) repeat protein